MKFVINGGTKLKGDIEVFGSKNAALPIIAATLLTTEPCVLENVPRIGDVLTMLEILKSMGSKQEWLGAKSIRIVNAAIDPSKINQALVSKIRASILLVGPLLARFGEVTLHTPGGCHIGVRPLEAHCAALQETGAIIHRNEQEGIYAFRLPKPTRSSIVLKEQSVTATELMMMLFALSDTSSEIKLAALEPHVEDLGHFLAALGVRVAGLGSPVITIQGSKKLGGARHSIIPDYIEAGTFLVLGAVAGEAIRIRNFPADHLWSVLEKAREFGIDYSLKNEELTVRSSTLHAASVKTQPHPGFPTDLQALFGLLATQAQGDSLIFDTLYEGRLKYIAELEKFGARAKLIDHHRVMVSGPSSLTGAEVQSLDLRAGAVMVIAALAAKGRSVLHGIEQIDRGYESLETRLRNLGADIIRTA